jgi:hypothetical protein
MQAWLDDYYKIDATAHTTFFSVPSDYHDRDKENSFMYYKTDVAILDHRYDKNKKIRDQMETNISMYSIHCLTKDNMGDLMIKIRDKDAGVFGFLTSVKKPDSFYAKKSCSYCGKETESLMICSNCKIEKYCSKICQKEQWGNHRISKCEKNKCSYDLKINILGEYHREYFRAIVKDTKELKSDSWVPWKYVKHNDFFKYTYGKIAQFIYDRYNVYKCDYCNFMNIVVINPNYPYIQYHVCKKMHKVLMLIFCANRFDKQSGLYILPKEIIKEILSHLLVLDSSKVNI